MSENNNAETTEVQPAAAAAAPAATPAAPAAPAAAPQATKEDEKKFTQSDIDRISGDIRRELRERIEAIEARENEVLLNSLAVNGVKRETLEASGLKGDALKALATAIASDIEAVRSAAPAAEQKPGLTLNEAMGGTSANGIPLAAKKPATLEEALDGLTLTEVK